MAVPPNALMHATRCACGRTALTTRGELRVITAEGELYLQDVRIALCRCGQSQKQTLLR